MADDEQRAAATGDSAADGSRFESAPPPLPPAVDGAASRGLGCPGCAALAGLALLLAWWLWPAGNGSPAFRAVFPAEAVFYVETGDVRRVGRVLVRSDLWREERAPEAGRHAHRALVRRIAAALGGVRRRDVADLLEQVDQAAFALAPGEEGTLAWMAALRMRDMDRAMRIVNEDLWLHQSHAVIDGVEASRVRGADDEPLWYRRMGRVLVVTPDERLLRGVLAARRRPGETLARTALLEGVDTDGALLAGLADVRTLRAHQIEHAGAVERLSRLVDGSAGGMLPDAEQVRRLDPDARIVFAMHGEDGLCTLRARVARLAEVGEGGGFWTVLAWIVLTPVALVLLVLLTLALITGAMAAYFYGVAWWRGELSPAVPPVEPELSPELQADLAAPRRCRRPDATPGDANDAPGKDAAADDGRKGDES